MWRNRVFITVGFLIAIILFVIITHHKSSENYGRISEVLSLSEAKICKYKQSMFVRDAERQWLLLSESELSFEWDEKKYLGKLGIDLNVSRKLIDEANQFSDGEFVFQKSSQVGAYFFADSSNKNPKFKFVLSPCGKYMYLKKW